jgi:hypothetical protein
LAGNWLDRASAKAEIAVQMDRVLHLKDASWTQRIVGLEDDLSRIAEAEAQVSAVDVVELMAVRPRLLRIGDLKAAIWWYAGGVKSRASMAERLGLTSAAGS